MAALRTFLPFAAMAASVCFGAVSCRSSLEHTGCQTGHPLRYSPPAAFQRVADGMLSPVANKLRSMPMARARQRAANSGDEFDLVCGKQAFPDQLGAGSLGIGREEQDSQILERP